MPQFKIGKPFNPYRLFLGVFIPNNVLSSDIPDSCKLLLGRLFQFAGETGKAFPSRKVIAKELSWELGKVDRTISQLKALKLLKTYQKDKKSPNIFTFLYHSMYEKPVVKIDNTSYQKRQQGVTKNSSTSYQKRQQGVTKNDNHKRIINKRINEESISSEEENTGKQISGKKTEEFDQEFVIKYFGPFKYSSQTKEILETWFSHGGKLHVKKGAKGPDKIDNIVEELLMKGGNPYNRVINDSDMASKQWELFELNLCIRHYVTILNKDITKMYLNDFVLHKHTGNGSKNKRRLIADHSPLVEVYSLIQTKSTTDEKILKRAKRLSTVLDPEKKVPKITFIKAAENIKDIEKHFKLCSSVKMIYNSAMIRLYLSYVEEKNQIKNITKFIGSENFKHDFITIMSERNSIMPIRAIRTQ